MNILFPLLLSLIIQAIFFAFAATFKTDKVTDLTYGLTFLIISLYLFFTKSTQSTYHIILLILISIWALRLASYLFIRILKIKRDKRFDGIRENFFKFASFWFLQGVTVWVVMLPSIVLFQSSTPSNLNPISVIGIIIWVIGIYIETMADYQKFIFKNDPKNKGKWIQSGLWQHARHPNYFGEMLCWWGIFIFVLPVFSGLSYLTILGPLFITYMLLFVSGIPTLESKYKQRYKDNNEYSKYVKNSNQLIPLPLKMF